MGSPSECRIVAQIRRHDAHLLELRIDVLVNVIRRRQLLGVIAGCFLGNNNNRCADGVGVEACHDKGLTALIGLDYAIVADRRGGFVTSHQHGKIGDVAVAAIGVVRSDGDLLLTAFALEDDVLREDFDASDLRNMFKVVWCASIEPTF